MKVIKFAFAAIAVLVVLGVGSFFYLGNSSQSGSAAGLVEGQLSPCPESPNCASSEAGTSAEKLVDALPLEAWERLPGVITALGGTVTEAEEAYLASEFSSSIFGFVDDVEFRKTDDAVHIRSASRVGYSDAGVNALRVTALREALTE